MARAKFFAAGLVCVLSSQASLAQQYEYLNLGTGSVSAINNAGQAVGSLYNAKGVTQAVVWNQGIPTYLPGLGGTSSAAAINDLGQIAGQSWNLAGSPQAVVSSAGAITTLASSPSYPSTGAAGINDHGLVVGNASQYYGGTSQAVVWNGFNITPLTNAGGTSSVATGVNNSGLITGYINGYPGTANPQAVVWQAGIATLLSNLRADNYAYSIANAVNDRGVVVGTASDADSNIHAVFWNNGNVASLNSLSGNDVAFGINDIGMVVGAMNANGGAAHAALWNSITGTGVDLNTLLNPSVLSAGITLVSAYGINDAGDIVGTSYNKITGNFGAFQLRAVPEPSTLAMWAIGLAGFFVRRRRPLS
jgi:probable HAF family extracellular repeat protein